MANKNAAPHGPWAVKALLYPEAIRHGFKNGEVRPLRLGRGKDRCATQGERGAEHVNKREAYGPAIRHKTPRVAKLSFQRFASHWLHSAETSLRPIVSPQIPPAKRAATTPLAALRLEPGGDGFHQLRVEDWRRLGFEAPEAGRLRWGLKQEVVQVGELDVLR